MLGSILDILLVTLTFIEGVLFTRILVNVGIHLESFEESFAEAEQHIYISTYDNMIKYMRD